MKAYRDKPTDIYQGIAEDVMNVNELFWYQVLEMLEEEGLDQFIMDCGDGHTVISADDHEINIAIGVDDDEAGLMPAECYTTHKDTKREANYKEIITAKGVRGYVLKFFE